MPRSRTALILSAATVVAVALTSTLAISSDDSASGASQGPLLLAHAKAPDPAHQLVGRFDQETIGFQVQRGDTLGILLATAGIDPNEADRAVDALRAVFDPRSLNIGQEVTISYWREIDGANPHLLRLVSIWLGSDSFVEVTRVDETRFVARRTKQPSLGGVRLDSAALSPHRIAEGDTLASLLDGEGVRRIETDAAVQALQKLYNPKKLRIGQELYLSLGTPPEPAGPRKLLGLSLKLDEDRFITVLRESGGHYLARRTSEPTLPRPGAPLKGAPLESAPLEAIVAAPTGSEPTVEMDASDWSAESAAVARGYTTESFSLTPANQLILAELFAEPDSLGGAAESISLTPDDQLILTTLFEEPDSVKAAPRPEPSEASRLPEIAHALTETLVLREGDTLMNALVRTGADRGEAHVAIRAFSEVINPRRLRVGQRLTVTFEPAGEGAAEMRLVGFALEITPDRLVEVVRTTNGLYTAAEIQRPLEHDMVRAAGTIESSLYEAAADAGMPVPILMELIRAFSFDVDFQREIHRGDGFEILFERSFTVDGEIVSVEPLRYAALTLDGTKLELIRFKMADGRVDYFDPKGQSARKALMRTPIDGARLTSTYGMRKHPILGYTKMHKGLDFGASKGTPIMAAGNGVIDALGPNGGYGNYVRIRHNSEYSTAYAHMNAFPKGLKRGDRVEQGQVIGYVGSTGRSTGPHLHYEVLVNSKQVNPLSVKLPTGLKLAGQELERFQAARERVLAELNGLPVVTQMAQTIEAH